MALHVDLCCNSPDDGQFTGFVTTIQIEEVTVVDFRLSMTQPREDGILKVGRLKLPVEGYRLWYGNWCWDRAYMRAIHVHKLLNYLIGLKYSHTEDSPDWIDEHFRKREPIPAEKFRTVLEFLRVGRVCGTCSETRRNV